MLKALWGSKHFSKIVGHIFLDVYTWPSIRIFQALKNIQVFYLRFLDEISVGLTVMEFTVTGDS